ncbi:MAG: hypothetical protein QE269_03365, partial [Fimbriimonas sp.]|nr:hypothetical protein [Fimbriimonas sp.]
QGVEALREWLIPPISPEEIAHSADLIRLRFYFISVIDADERLAFIDDSLQGLRKRVGFVEERMRLNAGDGHYFATLAGLSSLMETKARIEWLEHVREWVVSPPADNSTWVDEILSDSPFRRD